MTLSDTKYENHLDLPVKLELSRNQTQIMYHFGSRAEIKLVLNRFVCSYC